MSDMTDPAQLERILHSVGVTNYDAQVVEALQLIAGQETEAIRITAHSYATQTDKKPGDSDVVALACKAHRFASAPSRAAASASLENARMLNSRPVAWPLGTDIRVPLDQAVAHRSDIVLRESLPTSSPPGRATAAVVDDAKAGRHALTQMPSPAGGYHLQPIALLRTGTEAGASSKPSTGSSCQPVSRSAGALAAFAQAFEDTAS